MQPWEEEQGTPRSGPSHHSPVEGKGAVPPKARHSLGMAATELPAQGPFRDGTAPLSSAEGRRWGRETLCGNKVSISIIQLILDPHYHG